MSFEHFLYRAKYKYGKYLNLKSPVDVTLELASVCNQRCDYCYHSNDKVPFKKGLMAEITARKILDQAAAMGVSSIKFNWRGESALNPCFEYITSHAKRLGFIDRVSNSNFNFPTDREDIFRAFCNQTKVKISLDSLDRTVMDAQRKGSNFNTILANISKFYNYRGRDNEIVIQMVKTNLNKCEDFKGEISALWPDATVSVRDCVSNRSDNSELYSDDNMNRKRVACYQAFARLIFDIDGNATCCCPDIEQKIYLGNIYSMKLKEIWDGQRLKVLQSMLKDGRAFSSDWLPCKNCSSLESYDGYKHNWKS